MRSLLAGQAALWKLQPGTRPSATACSRRCRARSSGGSPARASTPSSGGASSRLAAHEGHRLRRAGRPPRPDSALATPSTQPQARPGFGPVAVLSAVGRTPAGVTPKMLLSIAGLYSTAQDYMRFAQMLANRGQLDGVRVLACSSSQADDQQPARGTACRCDFDQPFAGVGDGMNLGISCSTRRGPTSTAAGSARAASTGAACTAPGSGSIQSTTLSWSAWSTRRAPHLPDRTSLSHARYSRDITRSDELMGRWSTPFSGPSDPPELDWQ